MKVGRLVARMSRARTGSLPALGPPSAWAPNPPPCPKGWEIGPPHFVGVGAQRSGTTWWFRLLTAHDAVASAPGSHKEVHFFDRFWAVGLPGPSDSDYQRHFPRPPGGIVGEWTPRYMHDVWAPAQLGRLAPDARLLVMLRDPVERYRSGLAHEAAKLDAPGPLFMAGDAFARGLYHQQLRRVLGHFDTTRVLVLQYEACLARPEAELRRTHDFLGLDAPRRLPDGIAERVNESPGAKPPLSAALRASLVDAYREDTSRLVTDFPQIEVELWPNMKGLVPL